MIIYHTFGNNRHFIAIYIWTKYSNFVLIRDKLIMYHSESLHHHLQQCSQHALIQVAPCYHNALQHVKSLEEYCFQEIEGAFPLISWCWHKMDYWPSTKLMPDVFMSAWPLKTKASCSLVSLWPYNGDNNYSCQYTGWWGHDGRIDNICDVRHI